MAQFRGKKGIHVDFDTVGPDGGVNKALAASCIGPKLGEHQILPCDEVFRLERAL